jgi:hypothetical protein
MVFLCSTCTHSFFIRLFSIIIPIFFVRVRAGGTAAGCVYICGCLGVMRAEDINCTVYDGLMSESMHAYIYIYTHGFFLFGEYH